MKFTPLRELQNLNQYKSGDLLVVFGELFNRGYANGLVKAAKEKGMKVVTGTVGRRDKDGTLRPLNKEELSEKTEDVINIPLEAGFDLAASTSGQTPVDQLQGVKMSGWKEAKIDWSAVNESCENGKKSFFGRAELFFNELQEKYITGNQNILFAHLMAVGFPRSKIVMTSSNRVFKGSGDRYQSSDLFWNSEIGKLCSTCFNEVTAETFSHLIKMTKNIRSSQKEKGLNTSYLAYGYLSLIHI